jgi:isoquinoline 1-oxidoreductase beta subunit
MLALQPEDAPAFLRALRVERPIRLSRRAFLRSTGMAGSGLLLGIGLSTQHRYAAAQQAPASVYPPAAFVRIAPDDTVTILVNKLEFGQGVFTSMPMLIADELDCAWSKVRAEHAPAAQVYAHPQYGIQITVGSTSISSSYAPFRVIGASARLMLLQAASSQWNAPVDKLDTREGVVYEIGGQKRRATYGSLAEAASRRPVPTKVGVKADARDFKLIGKPTRRIDAREKVNGSAKFGIDHTLPNMRVALVARPPVFGGRAASFDPARALAVSGVEKVVQIPLDRRGTGVAVVAKGFWAAKQGRDALDIKWELPPGPTTSEQVAQYRQLAGEAGATALRRGEDGTMQRAARLISAEFEFPYLAHAPMEPLNAVVDLVADKLTLWCGSQSQTIDQIRAAQAAGLQPEQVDLVTTFAGGAFGRRASSDYAVEAVQVAVAMKKEGLVAPVKVMWTREDDVRGGYYRPLHLHRVEVGIDAKGQPLAWQHTIVGQSILKGTAFERSMVKDGVDSTMVEGVVDTPYRLPNMQVTVHHPEVNVPVLWWRSVGHSHTAYVVESLVDELAIVAKQDPIAYRLALLDTGNSRHRNVLNLVREHSGWGKPAPTGRARGVAIHQCRDTVCAQVAEVSIVDNRIRVHRVTAAVDCGTAVNPLTIEAQMQSAIAFGLSAALLGRISLKNGQVEQSNFTDYPVLRMNEMPEVSVQIVPSTARPTGVGEVGTPPIAPAVANAVAALTGKRLRRLPFDLASA